MKPAEPLHSWNYFTRPLNPNQPQGRSLLFYIDLAYNQKGPLDTHPVSGYVQVAIQKPDAAGQAASDEAQILKEIEAQLLDGLQSISPAGVALYVGRVVGDNICTFYYYLAAAHGVKKFVARLGSAFPGYAMVSGTRSDPRWSVYSQLLPDRVTTLRIQSRRQCVEFERSGDPLTTVRSVQHWAVFPSDKTRQSFIHSTLLLGYKSGYKSDAPELFGIQVLRDEAPSLERMDTITAQLYELADSIGGVYEGWQSTIVTAI